MKKLKTTSRKLDQLKENSWDKTPKIKVSFALRVTDLLWPKGWFYCFPLLRGQRARAETFTATCILFVFVFVPQPWDSDEAIEEDMPESPGVEKHDKEKEHRDSKKNRGLCGAKWC